MRCFHLLVEHHYLDEARLDLALVVYSPEGADHYLDAVHYLAPEDAVHFDSVLEDAVHSGLVHLDEAHLDFALVDVARLVLEVEVHFDFALVDVDRFGLVLVVLYNFFVDLFCVDRSFLMSVNLSDLPTLQILVLLLYSYW
jgi:hypothetical protein